VLTCLTWDLPVDLEAPFKLRSDTPHCLSDAVSTYVPSPVTHSSAILAELVGWGLDSTYA